MPSITILKRQTGKGHLTSADEANDTVAISGLVRTAAGAASLYTDGNTTSITIGASGTPTTIDDNLIVSGEIRGPSDGTGIVIGQAGTGASTGSTAQLASLTTAERDDLIEADGMLVYNETVLAFQGRVSGVWETFGESAPPELQITYIASFTTTDNIGALVTGLTFTPAAGTYKVVFSGGAYSQNNNSAATMTVQIDGSPVANATRTVMSGGGPTSSMQVGFCLETEVTVNGSEAIEARLAAGVGTTAELFPSSFSILEVS